MTATNRRRLLALLRDLQVCGDGLIEVAMVLDDDDTDRSTLEVAAGVVDGAERLVELALRDDSPGGAR